MCSNLGEIFLIRSGLNARSAENSVLGRAQVKASNETPRGPGWCTNLRTDLDGVDSFTVNQTIALGRAFLNPV